MPSYMLDELFAEAAPGTRRVYLCTNVAESSITVDVDVVIDTGCVGLSLAFPLC